MKEVVREYGFLILGIVAFIAAISILKPILGELREGLVSWGRIFMQ